MESGLLHGAVSRDDDPRQKTPGYFTGRLRSGRNKTCKGSDNSDQYARAARWFLRSPEVEWLLSLSLAPVTTQAGLSCARAWLAESPRDRQAQGPHRPLDREASRGTWGLPRRHRLRRLHILRHDHRSCPRRMRPRCSVCAVHRPRHRFLLQQHAVGPRRGRTVQPRPHQPQPQSPPSRGRSRLELWPDESHLQVRTCVQILSEILGRRRNRLARAPRVSLSVVRAAH